MDIIVATSNKGKLKEFKVLLADYFDNIYSLKDVNLDCDVEETGLTFEENSLIKAQYVKSKTKMAVIADDSGLEVEALNGAPGVYSARYSGENATDETNRQKLFCELEGKDNRNAQFTCVVTMILPDGKVYVGKGFTKGRILKEEFGQNGFGYDCMFWSNEIDKCFGLASAEEKNAVSHRYKAVKDLLSKYNDKK